MFGSLLKGFFSIFSKTPPKTIFWSEEQLKNAFLPMRLMAGISSVVKPLLSQEAKASSPISSTFGIFTDLMPLHSLKASLPIFFTWLKSTEVISSLEERRDMPKAGAPPHSSSPPHSPLVSWKQFGAISTTPSGILMSPDAIGQLISTPSWMFCALMPKVEAIKENRKKRVNFFICNN